MRIISDFNFCPTPHIKCYRAPIIWKPTWHYDQREVLQQSSSIFKKFLVKQAWLISSLCNSKIKTCSRYPLLKSFFQLVAYKETYYQLKTGPPYQATIFNLFFSTAWKRQPDLFCKLLWWNRFNLLLTATYMIFSFMIRTNVVAFCCKVAWTCLSRLLRHTFRRFFASHCKRSFWFEQHAENTYLPASYLWLEYRSITVWGLLKTYLS